MSLDEGVIDLYVVLTSEIIPLYLERSYKEFYDTGDSVTDLECMNDDISRAWRLVEWHDKLAEIDTTLWKFLESDNPNDLELRFKESAWLYRLKKRIKIELKLRELNNDTVGIDKNKELLLEFCDFLLESVPSLDFLDKDNPKRLQLIEDFLENWSGKNE